MARVRVGITLGCPSGIGFEVVRKSLERPSLRKLIEPVLFGDASQRIEGVELRAISALAPKDRKPGRPTTRGGLAQYAYLTAAIAAAKAGEVQALCTAPVSKEHISKAGIAFQGHTEVLAEAFGVEVLMLMKGPTLSVALATNHLPISKVPGALSTAHLVKQLSLLSASFQTLLGRRPRIAVCGLNPHAGDGGVLGDEEARIIAPAITLARKQRLDVHGPFAADGLFAKARAFPYDVALAMFHDQGLVATKTFDFENTVNVTLGLPVLRTSPDHGVAYDIAGRGLADAKPMEAALRVAAGAGSFLQRRMGSAAISAASPTTGAPP